MKAIAAKQGKYQIQEVTYNNDGTSNVKSCGKWIVTGCGTCDKAENCDVVRNFNLCHRLQNLK